MWMVAFVVGTALAGEPVVPCTDPDCATLEQALLETFADAGLVKVDGIDIDVDAAGQPWVTVTSADELGLLAIAPKSSAPVVRGPTGSSRTVPLYIDALSPQPATAGGVDVLGMIEIEAGAGGGGGGGGGSGGESCTEVCVCTEDGPECWWEC